MPKNSMYGSHGGGKMSKSKGGKLSVKTPAGAGMKK